MAGPRHRELRRWVVAVGCLISCAGLLAGSSGSDYAPHRPIQVLQPKPMQVLQTKMQVLQLNLCDSGFAGCYSGRSVTEAAAVILAVAPDLVTLNEVCRNDVSALQRSLTQARPDGTVVSAFMAAGDRPTASAYRCRNGQPYGIGLLARIPGANRGYTTDGDSYPVQDEGDPEERVWLCLHATGLVSVCTTHLASTVPTITLAQCEYLLRTIVPAVRARHGYLPFVLGGDLNVRHGGVPDAQSCLSSGYLYADDGDTQYVLTTTGSTLGSPRLIDMHRTTDHPGILVTVSPT